MATSENFKDLRKKHRQFFLVVYTQTDADVNHYVCGGGLDLGLNEAGMEEARKLARRFKKNPFKVKKMVAGPELRCIQMADLIHDEMRTKLVLSRDFSDQFLGELEGKPLTATLDFKNPPRGETSNDFAVRVRKGLEGLLSDDEMILLITHPRVANVLFHWVGLGGEKIEHGVIYSIDLPIGSGVAHYRKL
jgi:broad specificity phosphatase PhoE